MWLKKNTLTTQYRIRKVDLVERNASVPLKAVPLKAADRTRKFRVLKPTGANPRFASAVRCFLSEIESLGAAVPRTKGHRKVDLVERNAPVFLPAAMTTVPHFDSSRDAVWGWGKVRAQCFPPSHLTPGIPRSNENPTPQRCG